MFGIIADLIAAATTILLPAYLSYKALRSSDPAQLTPWLIYFVLLTLTLLVESWTVFIIGWMPFYSWFRLFFLLYLVLPQTQGAKVLYLQYVEPFIVEHERSIDEFIGDLHEKLQSAGLGYLGQLVDIIREKVLGQNAPAAAPPEASTAGGYAQNLLSRFAMPDARTNALNRASDVYGMLSGVAGAAMGGAAATKTRDFSSSDPSSFPSSATDPIIPPNIMGGSNTDKSNYISTQRERLTVILKALEKEQQTLDLAYGDSSNLSKSKSEASFETISHSEGLIPPNVMQQQNYSSKANSSSRRTASGGWVSSWFSGAPSADPSPVEEKKDSMSRPGTASSKGWSAAKEITEAMQGMSSSVDTGH